jgi:membrane protein required for colicin V production
MTLLDWIIIALLALSVLDGLRSGFIVSAVSLLGLVVAILAAGRYWWVAMPLVRLFATRIWVIELVSFFVVALCTVLVLTLGARALRRAVASIGLGWLDRLLGGVFGLLRGGLVVVIGFIIVAAFVPSGSWTKGSRFAPYFLSAAQTATRSAPAAAANRLAFGLDRNGGR